jgi:ribosomal protein S30
VLAKGLDTVTIQDGSLAKNGKIGSYTTKLWQKQADSMIIYIRMI